VIIAGIGCRRGCAGEAIAALVRRAEAAHGVRADALAAPDFKRNEPGIAQAAALLGLTLRFADRASLQAAQPRCLTRSDAAERATGLASVAEAAALAAGGTLLGPRLAGERAPCALVRR
jgi:cobalt-precorrin 5A hydrolase